MLVPSLVPEPLWGLSASKLLTRKQWSRIRLDTLSRASSRCSHCGTYRDKGQICHEIWDYDDKAGIATLTDLRIVCRACNNVHHIGLAGKRGYRDEALAHMAAVNGSSIEEAASLSDGAYGTWRVRSQRPWILRVDPRLLSLYPELTVVDGLAGSPGDGTRRMAEIDTARSPQRGRFR